MDLIKTLASDTRRSILKLLLQEEYHIAGLAGKLKLASPVVLKHLERLYAFNLISRRKVGTSTVISITQTGIDMISTVEGLIEQSLQIQIAKNTTVYDILKQIPGFEIRRWKNTTHYYIHSIDGIEGNYMFRINGKFISESIDTAHITESSTISFQKMTPVIGKTVEIDVVPNK